MRIRQIKPSFWTDVRLAELPPAVRLTYIGLWMIADDGGWFQWDPPQVANELYGYEPRHRREKAVRADIDALVTIGRVVLFPCGHAIIPTLVSHQRVGDGKRVLTVQRVHGQCPAGSGSPVIATDSGASPVIPTDSGDVTVRNGKVRNGTVRVRNGSTPTPSQARGRLEGTNPRATGSNPRARGTSRRQVEQGYKTGPTALGDVLRRAVEQGDS